jgi:hypothetical protein
MEYLASEMVKYIMSRDPSYKMPKKLEKFDPDL